MFGVQNLLNVNINMNVNKIVSWSRVANFQTLVWDLRHFVTLQTFQLLFLYMPKTNTSLHIPSQNNQLYFAKNFCVFRQKREKRLHPTGSSCGWAGLWPAVTHMLSTLQIFQTFLKHNLGTHELKLGKSFLL